MSQGMKTINDHIKTYLDFYCDLSDAPEFAVLLKGQWGSGKTWFINRYREKFKKKDKKCLYVSLYGMTQVSDIDDAIFQQLHPLLSSKKAALVRNILTGALKLTTNIDWNNNGQDDSKISLQIPEIDLPKYFNNTESSILIFDDLERCEISINNVLGYINYFVEHQGLKVIIVANEEKLETDNNYNTIKEKLIGKTFCLALDFEGALENFITINKSQGVRDFLSKNIELIQDLYKKAEYKNLRSLKQVILDFERVFDYIPKVVKDNPKALQKILELLIAFSIQIKCGEMSAKDICKINYTNSILPIKKDNDDNSIQPLIQLIKKYPSIDFMSMFPSKLWWQIFLDEGVFDNNELNQSISSSKYFQNQETPDWIRLFHYRDLSDDDFSEILNRVKGEYIQRTYTEVGVIKHIVGLFLKFSDVGLFSQSKNEILENSRQYIDCLRDRGALATNLPSTTPSREDAYGSLVFQGMEFQEFQEFFSYIKEIQGVLLEASLPDAGQDLLGIMETDVGRFYRMICPSSSRTEETPLNYCNIPVLKFIEANSFVERSLSLSPRDHLFVYTALEERYSYASHYKKLVEELEWLKSVRSLLQVKVSNKAGKLSGVILKSDIIPKLNSMIKELERSTIVPAEGEG